jgi:hypothetical protein
MTSDSTMAPGVKQQHAPVCHALHEGDALGANQVHEEHLRAHGLGEPACLEGRSEESRRR